MSLLEEYIARESAELRERGVAVRMLGDLDRLHRRRARRGRPDRGGDRGRHRARAQYLHLLRLPGRDRARGAAAGGRRGGGPADARPRSTRRRWRRRLYTAEWPDPDLLIRTSGEHADLELPALAAGLRRAVRHAGAVARLHPPPSLRGHSRFPAPRPPVRARAGAPDGTPTWPGGVGSPPSRSRSRWLIVWYGGFPLAALVAVAARARHPRAVRSGRARGRPAARGCSACADARRRCRLADLAGARPMLDVRGCRRRRWPYARGAAGSSLLLTWALAARAPRRAAALGRGRHPARRRSTPACCPAFLLVIRHGAAARRSPGPATWLVFFPLVVTWVCDTAAMFGGRAIGGPEAGAGR